MKTAREEILEKLKNIPVLLPEKPDFSEDVFSHPVKKGAEGFKAKLEQVHGKVHIYEDEKDLYENLRLLLQQFNRRNIISREPEIQARLLKYMVPFAEEPKPDVERTVEITSCEFLISRTGSVMMSSAQSGGRQSFVSPVIHVVIAKSEQMVPTLEQAYAGIMKKYGTNLPSQVTLVTGPSRTADIEKVLTLGAHGPKELHVFLH